MALVRIGADPFPPYQYYDEKGEIIGADFEIIKEAFKLTGNKIIVELQPWIDTIKKIENGVFDAIFQVQPTQERRKQYIFSDLLRNAKTCLFSRINDKIIDKSFSGINNEGIPIGMLKGYSYGEPIDSIKNDNKILYEDQESLIIDISEGKLHLGIFDYGVSSFLQAKLGINNVTAINNCSFDRPLHVMFKKNKKVFAENFNTGLSKLRKSGGYTKIYIKYKCFHKT